MRLWVYLVDRQPKAKLMKMFRVYEWDAVLPEQGRRASPKDSIERLAALGRDRLLERVDHGIAEVIKRFCWDYSTAGRADHGDKHHYDRFRSFGLEVRGRYIEHLSNWGVVFATPYGIVGYEWIPDPST